MASTIQVRGDYVKLVIMDMWIPLQIPSKGMEHHDKSGSEIQGLALLVKHLGNNTVHGGGAESAVAPEGYEFELSTSRTAVHCPAKGGVAAVDHFIHVFNNRSAWM